MAEQQTVSGNYFKTFTTESSRYFYYYYEFNWASVLHDEIWHAIEEDFKAS